MFLLVLINFVYEYRIRMHGVVVKNIIFDLTVFAGYDQRYSENKVGTETTIYTEKSSLYLR